MSIEYLTVSCVRASTIVQLPVLSSFHCLHPARCPSSQTVTYGGRVFCVSGRAVWNSIREIMNTLQTHHCLLFHLGAI